MVSSSTFSGNSASSSGGGILNYFGSMTVSNSIMANSASGTNCDGSYTDGGGNISYPDQTCPGQNADPKLDPNGLQANGGPTQTIALLPDSPAIGAATGDCPDTDQRGVERPQGAACDSGAYELITNHPPVAQNDSYSTTQNTPLTISAPGVLENDSDPDGDTLSAVKASDPAHGTLVLNADGSFIYTPAAGYSGSDSFSYTGSDGATTSTQAEVTITVKAASFPATAVLDNFNRANGKVGSSWEGLTESSFYKLASNKLDVQLGGPLVWKPASFGAAQEAFLTLSTIDSKSPSMGVLLKVQTGSIPNAGAISVVYDAKAKAVRVSALRLGQNGAWTLYPNQAATFANGDVLGARAKADGTVQIYKNGTLITTVTLNAADQAFFNTKGGKIGIWTAAAPNALFDDFGGGTAP
jgi:VCBS repeat-containing protein